MLVFGTRGLTGGSAVTAGTGTTKTKLYPLPATQNFHFITNASSHQAATDG